MPATAGRVRMPANNRVHSSAALQTHSIWQSAIGYDPYAPAPNKEADNKGAPQAVPSSAPATENTYNSFQGLLALARVTNSNADEARGCCKKCGRVGHLSFQCRNFLSIKDNKDKDLEAIEAAVMAGLDKVKGNRGKGKGTDGGESLEESSEEEESESSDSDYDSEIERAIAKKLGKKASSLLKSSSRKKKDDSDDDVSDRGDRKKRGRSRKRRSGKKVDSESDSGDDRRHGRRGSKREKRRKKSHREVEDLDSSEGSDEGRKRSRSRRVADDSYASRLEDSRVGRERKKYSEKESRKQQLYEREL